MEALHIFAENKPARLYNETLLYNLSTPLISIHAEDEIPKTCSSGDIAKAKNRSQSKTGGPALLLRLKVDVMVTITANIDILID